MNQRDENASDKIHHIMTSLYLCYQSLLEPLTQTQVVAYLEGLAKADYRIVLLTFESRRLTRDETLEWRNRMAAKGIIWHWLRYHKRPTLMATTWDVLCGMISGILLIRKYDVRLVHARAHVPGFMGLVLKRLTGAKLLFDVRGLMAEEYVDAGIWPVDGVLFRLVKRIERRIVAATDGVVVLTQNAKALLEEWYEPELANKQVEVIPCCFDLRAFEEAAKKSVKEREAKTRSDKMNAMRSKTALTAPLLIYVGKLGGWYLTRDMIIFIASASHILRGLRSRILTQSHTGELKQALVDYRIACELTIDCVAPADIPGELMQAHFGLSFIKPCFSKIASSPTKLAEYLAAGLPVVATAGIGDTDAILTNNGAEPVGVLVHEQSEEGYRLAAEKLKSLLSDPETPNRCRHVAKQKFDLETIGWSRYRKMYAVLLSSETKPSLKYSKSVP